MNDRLATFRDKLTPAALTALRVGVGVILIAHGYQKLANPDATAAAFASIGIPVPSIAVWFAVAGEFFGGLGLLIGFLTPLAPLGAVCTMATAIGFAHLGNGLMAKNNGWEYPLTLLLVSLFFVFRGAGPISVDALVRRKQARDERPKHYVRAGHHPAGSRA